MSMNEIILFTHPKAANEDVVIEFFLLYTIYTEV